MLRCCLINPEEGWRVVAAACGRNKVSLRELLESASGRLIPFAAAFLLAAPPEARADERPGERLAVLEMGAAGEHESSGGANLVGPAIGLEIEPIEDRLEIELGASMLRRGPSTTWDVDLPFKRPFRLSSRIEVMPGIGPTWEYTSERGEIASQWGAEVVLDVFIWRTERYGWFVEPAYGMGLNRTHPTSILLTGGLFLSIP